jgi:hypothetical protein
MGTVQTIPAGQWTRSAVYPRLWVYQDTGTPVAGIEWQADGTWTIGTTGRWGFATGDEPPPGGMLRPGDGTHWRFDTTQVNQDNQDNQD